MTTPNAEFKDAPRLQASLTAKVERKALNYLAARLPRWVNSDHLTMLGLMAMVAAGACYAAARWWPPAILIVNLWLAVNWFGDSLDGTLARLRNRQRPRYGFYVDHIVDALGILAILCGLALSGYMSWVVALAFLVAYFLLSIDVYLATYTIGAFRMAYCKLGPTELRILLAVGNVAAFLKPRARVLGDHLLLDVATLISVAVLLVITAASIARNTATLYRAEKI
ncbi:MAG TPA: CDP-alcohol phosphatidyltransferase family protein [Blastocatellia bacterium]|nr:CDP-alcohol phosphatidyltransferase family protein [Blastocatellia bacterium]